MITVVFSVGKLSQGSLNIRVRDEIEKRIEGAFYNKNKARGKAVVEAERKWKSILLGEQ